MNIIKRLVINDKIRECWRNAYIDGVMAAIDYTDSHYEIIILGNNRTLQLLELVELLKNLRPQTIDH